MVPIKNKNEIKILKEGGAKLAFIMAELEKAVKPGVSTMEIDDLAEKLIYKEKGTPSFKGYGSKEGNPFPSTICASINEEIVHGIPSDEIILKKGDIFKIDIGMKYKGMHTDMARTFAVGKISQKKKKIIDVVRESFYEGVDAMQVGVKMNEYSKAVQRYVEKNGFSVVRDLVGHGIGYELHEDPQIPNYFNKNYGNFILKPGMVFALEPMINAGTHRILIGDDEWVFVTADKSVSAHWENTVIITQNGVEIITDY
ncbi:MAG: type I methionyl aminopeptidase [Candidatus Moranbacteria bacterium]|nr:type I methionyl aminopeptidase [Candidatus Moranbacteria bacterium]